MTSFDTTTTVNPLQTGLLAIELVSKLNQVSVDTRALVREYALENEVLSVEHLQRMLKHLGFWVKAKPLSLEQLTKGYPLPAIVVLPDQTYLTILAFQPEQEKFLIFSPTEKNTKSLSKTELTLLLGGGVLFNILVLKHKKRHDELKFGFRWFFNEILHYRLVVAEVLVGSFIVQLFGLVTPLFTQVILDKVIVHRTMTTLYVLAVGYVLVTIFELLLNLSRQYIFTHTANKIDSKLGTKLFRQLFSLPFAYFEARKLGTVISRIREMETIRDFITNKSVTVIIDLFFSLVFVVMMLLYSVPLTLIVLAFVVVLAILYVVFTPEFRRRLEQKFQMMASSNAALVESVTGVQTVKSLAIEGAIQKRWEENLGDHLGASFKLSTLSNVLGGIGGCLQKLLTIAMLFFGVKLVIENKLTVGQLIAFQMFANQFTGPVLRLVNLWNEFQQTLLAVDRLGDILHHPTEVVTDKAITLPRLEGYIRFDNIAFRYAPEAPMVLKGVSFEIQAGQSVGLVGRSGSGKSTVAKLIQRLYLTTEGAIFVDGIDVRHLNPLWLRHNIGVVLQENYLFSGTIRENISLPKPDASIEQIIKVAELAGAHEFITALPEGYDTMVGERGSSLSGGQKQRVAIARALITNPKILIFDEATSALDYESERVIQQNLQAIRQGRTVVMIAHRLSTVNDCDQIVVFDQGQIVEMGSPKILLQQKGLYTHLYEQQFGSSER